MGSDLLTNVAAGAGGAGLLGLLLRYLFITFYSTKSQTTSLQLGDSMLTRMQDEIKRLEGIIGKLNDRIGSLEHVINRLRLETLDDLSDIAQINAIVETMCVHSNCGSGEKLREILRRIYARRDRIIIDECERREKGEGQ
jgi:hypothetical protein